MPQVVPVGLFAPENKRGPAPPDLPYGLLSLLQPPGANLCCETRHPLGLEGESSSLETFTALGVLQTSGLGSPKPVSHDAA